jgi:hypothetical protein
MCASSQRHRSSLHRDSGKGCVMSDTGHVISMSLKVIIDVLSARRSNQAALS